MTTTPDTSTCGHGFLPEPGRQHTAFSRVGRVVTRHALTCARAVPVTHGPATARTVCCGGCGQHLAGRAPGPSLIGLKMPGAGGDLTPEELARIRRRCVGILVTLIGGVGLFYGWATAAFVLGGSIVLGTGWAGHHRRITP